MSRYKPGEGSWLDAEGERFEGAWDWGERPRIEDFLIAAPESRRPSLLRHLLVIDLQRRLSLGEAPVIQEYEQRFPSEYRQEIQAAFVEVLPAHAAGSKLRGASVRPRPSPNLPDPFPGEFRFLRKIGGGAYGDVYEAEDLKMGSRKVAIKTLKSHLDNPSVRAQTLAALHAEVVALSKFRHRNIVLVHAWREANGEPFVILEYVPGGSLVQQMTHARSLSWQKAARYVADVAEALLTVHSRGILHRDIKPANILLDSEKDEAMLTDFGLAALASSGGHSGGTPHYMAPEAFHGRAGELADVYSLAATFFHLVAGEPPFSGENRRELLHAKERGLANSDARFADIPDVLERIVREGLSPTPRHRPSLKEFSMRLRAALAELLVDLLPTHGASAFLRLYVSREAGPNRYEPVPTESLALGEGRNVKAKDAPKPISRRPLRTGDALRIEAIADQAGYLAVLNVGPTGDLNMVYPRDPLTAASPPKLPAHRQLHLGDVELEPPAGRERLVALWTRGPISIDLGGQTPLEPNEVSPSEEYRATRTLEHIRQAIQELPASDCQTVVLEFQHKKAPFRPWEPVYRVFRGFASWASSVLLRRKSLI
jgi:serine/threonine protein kinase